MEQVEGRIPGFFAVVWFGSTPASLPSAFRAYRVERLTEREGGSHCLAFSANQGRGGKDPKKTTAKAPGLFLGPQSI